MFTERKKFSRLSRREKLPWSDGKKFKILSLDGGGIRGVFGSSILSRIENEYGPCRNYFDLIAGTSTGGIMAIGLGLEIPAHKIDSIYVDEGNEIFPRPRNPFLRTVSQFFRPVHDHSVLEKKLKEHFGDRLFGDSLSRLVVPAFAGPSPQIAVLKTDHHPDYKRDWEMAAWEAARSTSAAPTYFEGYGGEAGYFLDGGVWANNPILCATIEALSSFELYPEQIDVLSIGTGSEMANLKEGSIRTGFIGWRKIITVAMGLTSDAALGQTNLLLGPERVLRLDPNVEPQIDLDDWTRAVKELPAQADLIFEEERAQIARFFVDQVSPRQRYYSISR